MTNVADLDHVDLGPAAARLPQLMASTPEDMLDAPSPCPAYGVGDLVDHVPGLAIAFTDAARKTAPATGSAGASGDASRLGDEWRTRIPQDLGSLAEAWRDPAAWSGTTEAGGLDLPGEVAGLVAMNELVVHGWDLARATGQPYQFDEVSLEAAHASLGSFATRRGARARSGRWSRCQLMHPWSPASSGSAAVIPSGRPDVVTQAEMS